MTVTLISIVEGDPGSKILSYLSPEDLSTAEVTCRSVKNRIATVWVNLENALPSHGRSWHASGTTPKARVVRTHKATRFAETMETLAGERFYGHAPEGFPEVMDQDGAVGPNCEGDFDFFVRLSTMNVPEPPAYEDDGFEEDYEDGFDQDEEEAMEIEIGAFEGEGAGMENPNDAQGEPPNRSADSSLSSHSLIWQGFVPSVKFINQAVQLDLRAAYGDMDWQTMQALTATPIPDGFVANAIVMTDARNAALNDLCVTIVSVRRNAEAKTSLAAATGGWLDYTKSIKYTHTYCWLKGVDADRTQEQNERCIHAQICFQGSRVAGGIPFPPPYDSMEGQFLGFILSYTSDRDADFRDFVAL